MMRRALVLLLCVSLLGCAGVVGKARRAMREPGERLLDLPDAVARDYECGERDLPHFELERNEINPKRIQAGSALNHRIVYALCPREATEVVSGTLVTQVRFKGQVVLRDETPGLRFTCFVSS